VIFLSIGNSTWPPRPKISSDWLEFLKNFLHAWSLHQSELIFGLGGHVEFPIDRKITNLVDAHPMKILVNHDGRHVMTITDHMPGKVYNGNLRVDK
jgi:hypothetical protein